VSALASAEEEDDRSRLREPEPAACFGGVERLGTRGDRPPDHLVLGRLETLDRKGEDDRLCERAVRFLLS
jgi:hypothetical protein